MMAVSLKSIVKNRELGPPRILLYAPHGIGKTTFGAGAPKPIFIPTEDGLNDIDCGGQAVAPFVGPDCDLVRAMLADGKLVSLRGQAGHVGYLLANHPASDRLLRFLREGT